MDTTGRDRALRRLSRLTRWSVGGAVVLTGVFSVLVAHSRPGRSNTTSTSVTSPAGTSPAGTSPSSGDTLLLPPAQVPSAGSGRGLVRSGAS